MYRSGLDDSVKLKQEYSKANLIAVFNQINNPWFRYFMQYDPTDALQKVRCPVLAINGAKDLQVPPKENLDAI